MPRTEMEPARAFVILPTFFIHFFFSSQSNAQAIAWTLRPSQIAAAGSSNKPTSQVHFQTVAKGSRSGVRETSQIVVRGQDQWQTLWHKHTSINTSPIPLPPIDFDKEIVLAVFLGEKPTGGYAIEITSADLSDGGLTVSFNEKGPRPGDMQIQAFTQPFHIVRITNHRSEEVRFRRVS